MTFLECINIALERVDEDITTTDEATLSVIKAGINQGYMLVAASSLNKILKNFITPFAKVIPMPDDFLQIDYIKHDNLGFLGKNEYKIDMTNIITNTIGIYSGQVTVSYASYPTQLINDADLLMLKTANCMVPAQYGAYTYMLYRKKYSAAQLLLNEFNTVIHSQDVQSL